ncbi:hypothetical protein KIN20_006830 [Parelaphostrongylus tenuis]|uniref:Uncharacterized protein n=1 Tax=Parelaphostrongylus tenuis TaxID=148309 RepID=A0AAD5M6N7_PARTN|nr:hypothetical protein KIN20_006830 [Parelaphostrongylus tenuis]
MFVVGNILPSKSSPNLNPEEENRWNLINPTLLLTSRNLWKLTPKGKRLQPTVTAELLHLQSKEVDEA